MDVVAILAGKDTYDVTFFCRNDFLLQGQNHARCFPNGSWSRELPRCLEQCPNLINIENIKASTKRIAIIYKKNDNEMCYDCQWDNNQPEKGNGYKQPYVAVTFYVRNNVITSATLRTSNVYVLINKFLIKNNGVRRIGITWQHLRLTQCKYRLSVFCISILDNISCQSNCYGNWPVREAYKWTSWLCDYLVVFIVIYLITRLNISWLFD